MLILIGIWRVQRQAEPASHHSRNHAARARRSKSVDTSSLSIRTSMRGEDGDVHCIRFQKITFCSNGDSVSEYRHRIKFHRVEKGEGQFPVLMPYMESQGMSLKKICGAQYEFRMRADFFALSQSRLTMINYI